MWSGPTSDITIMHSHNHKHNHNINKNVMIGENKYQAYKRVSNDVDAILGWHKLQSTETRTFIGQNTTNELTLLGLPQCALDFTFPLRNKHSHGNNHKKVIDHLLMINL